MLRIIILCFAMTALFAQAENEVMRGKASYYGSKFHGRLTASGEVFDQNEMTCAHRTLPFGTMLKVKNLTNGKEVIVEVNDRGPFCEGRIVDLSRAAAEKIGMINKGVVKVEVVEFNPEEDLKDLFTLPDLYLSNPATGKAHTFEQWAELDGSKKKKSKVGGISLDENRGMAKGQVKMRWHVDESKPLAQKLTNHKQSAKRTY